MPRSHHAENKPSPERGGVSSSAPKEALKHEGELEKKHDKEHEAKSEREKQDEKLDKALMESFPGSDPVANTQPTKPEPAPPKKKGAS